MKKIESASVLFTQMPFTVCLSLSVASVVSLTGYRYRYRYCAVPPPPFSSPFHGHLSLRSASAVCCIATPLQRNRGTDQPTANTTQKTNDETKEGDT